jgi:cytochrome c peroxidase
MRQRIRAVVFILSVSAIVTAGCSRAEPEPERTEPAVEMLQLPSDPARYAPHPRFEPMAVPAENPIAVEKATLGWQLWFDTRLSGNGDRSCYGCHVNEKGLTDGLVKNTSAVDGKPLARHTPTLWNIGYHQEWYWDGRAKTLEGQALAAWKLANMGAKDPNADKIRDDVIARINSVPGYTAQFQKVFGGPATEANVSQALATYMRTIVSRDTAFDRFEAGDQSALSDGAKRGWEVFQKAECTNCHRGVFFTDLQFHNVGIGVEKGKPTDVGRFNVTKIEKDTGAFKTPTLRDVARSAPYFHDGSVATLEEAVKLMASGGVDNPFLDTTNLKRKQLSDAEIKDIVEFLGSLTETTTLRQPKIP